MPPIHGSFPWCFFRPFRQARHSWSWLAGEQTYVACLCAISTPSVSQIPPIEPYVRTSSIPALTRNRKLDQTCLRAGRPKAVHKRPPPCMPNLLDQGGRHLFDRSSTQSVRNRAFLPSWLVGIVLYPQLQCRIKMSKKSGGSKLDTNSLESHRAVPSTCGKSSMMARSMAFCDVLGSCTIILKTFKDKVRCMHPAL